MFKVGEANKRLPVYKNKETGIENTAADTVNTSILYEFTYDENDPNEKMTKKRKYRQKRKANKKQVKFNFGNEVKKQPLRAKKLNEPEILNPEFKRQTRNMKKIANKGLNVNSAPNPYLVAVTKSDNKQDMFRKNIYNNKLSTTLKNEVCLNNMISDLNNLVNHKNVNDVRTAFNLTHDASVISDETSENAASISNRPVGFKDTIKPILREKKDGNKRNSNHTTGFHVRFESPVSGKVENKLTRISSQNVDGFMYSNDQSNSQEGSKNMTRNSTNKIKFSSLYAAESSDNFLNNEFDDSQECYWDTLLSSNHVRNQNAEDMYNVDEGIVNAQSTLAFSRTTNYNDGYCSTNDICTGDRNTLFDFDDEKPVDFNTLKPDTHPSTSASREESNKLTISNGNIRSKDTFFGFDDEDSIVELPVTHKVAPKSGNKSSDTTVYCNKQHNKIESERRCSRLRDRVNKHVLLDQTNVNGCRLDRFLGFDEELNSNSLKRKLSTEVNINYLNKLISELSVNPSPAVETDNRVVLKTTSFESNSDLQVNKRTSPKLNVKNTRISGRKSSENVFSGTEQYFIFNDPMEEFVNDDQIADNRVIIEFITN